MIYFQKKNNRELLFIEKEGEQMDVRDKACAIDMIMEKKHSM